MQHAQTIEKAGPELTPPPQELPAGTMLHDTYQILHPLAEGGCGAVYAAAHARLPGHFAVKVLHRGLIRNLEAMTRFRQEAEITSTLRHPHIVQVLDFNVTEGGLPYLVMELLQGRSLSARLLETGAMDPAAAVRIVEQIAQALQAAHAQGIVHRDLKPDNVMLLAADGVQDFVKVLDFGISQASWRPRLTDNARVAGTPQFMAPEQACGLREELGPWTDQFSLAAITYLLLTGREPFSADDPIAVLYQVVHHDPPPPTAHAPLCPAVDAAILRGLAKKPADRFPDVLSFAAALREAVAELPGTFAREPELQPAAAAAPTQDGAPAPPRPAASTPPPASAPGPQTQRLIRQVRRRIHRGPARVALLAVTAAALAAAGFSPAVRTRSTDAWHRARAEAERLLGQARLER
jgi:serine/threonine protein kinase